MREQVTLMLTDNIGNSAPIRPHAPAPLRSGDAGLRPARQRAGDHRRRHRPVPARQPRHGLRRAGPADQHGLPDVRHRHVRPRRAGQPDPGGRDRRAEPARPLVRLRRLKPPDQREDRQQQRPDGDRPGLRRARQPGQQERAGLPVHPGQPPGRGGGPGGLPLRRAGPPGAGVVAHAGQHPVAVRPRRAPGLPAGPAPQRAGGAGVPWARAGWPGASR